MAYRGISCTIFLASGFDMPSTTGHLPKLGQARAKLLGHRRNIRYVWYIHCIGTNHSPLRMSNLATCWEGTAIYLGR